MRAGLPDSISILISISCLFPVFARAPICVICQYTSRPWPQADDSKTTLRDHEKAQETVEIGGTTSPAPEIRWVSWKAGYRSVNQGTRSWPIGNIWFNDMANIQRAQGKDPASFGWMDSLIDGGSTGTMNYRGADYTALNIPLVNADAGSPGPDGTVQRIVYDGLKSKNPPFGNIAEGVLAPPGGVLEEVVKHLNTAPKEWKGTAAKYRANQAKGAVYPTTEGWAKMEAEKAGRDNSLTNLSSIMFTVTAGGKRILMTGDTAGWILNEALGSVASPPKWDIIKVLHHGSSNNNILKDANTTLVDGVAQFFTTFQADKYVISSDTWNRVPNPDLAALRGMAKAFYQDGRKRNIYLTNGLSYQGWEEMLFDVTKDASGNDVQTPKRATLPIDIFALKKADTCDYGTVVPSMDPLISRPEVYDWMILKDNNQFGAYNGARIENYFGDQAFMKVSGNPRAVAQILPFLKNLLGRAGPTSRRLGGKARTIFGNLTVATRKSIPRGAKGRINYKTSKARTLRSAHEKSAIPPPPPVPKTVLTWHDIMVANLMNVPDLTAEDLEDILTPPTAVPTGQVTVDGTTASWVDLPTFLSFIRTCNAQVVPSAATPQLSPDYLATLSYWFLSVADPSKEETPILAWMLLSLLLGPEPATELLTAFPVNPNGPSSATLNPFTVTSPAAANSGTGLAMWSMLVQNFRALIVVPTGAALQVQCFYFELAPPPPELNSISSKDFLTWTVPFANAGWSVGQVSIAHTQNLRVKMKWPLYLDAITFCHFDGTLTVSRGSPVTFPVHGTMYLQRGAAASYDIQLKKDPTTNSPISALAVLTALSPEANMASTLLTNIAATIDIPGGMDLSQVIHKDMVFEDAGVILRQHNPLFTAVSVDDLYGTVSVDQVLQFGADLLPFPSGLNIPPNLPDVTLIIGNATGRGEKVSIAFSQAVAGIGTVALEVGPAVDGQTKFDIWTVCEDGVTVNDILQRLEQATRLPDFQSASMFTASLLSGLAVPYTHLTLGPAAKYTPGKYTMQDLTLIVEVVEDISFPPDSPLITLRDLTFQIMYTFAEGTAAGATGSLALMGNASVQLGNFDAICTFTLNKDADVIEADLDEGDDSDNPTAAANLAEAQANATGGFQGYVDFSFRFQSRAPSIGDIVNAFLLEPLDQVGSLAIHIPSEFRDILDAVDFQALEMRAQKDATTQNKWEIVVLHLQVRLPGLTDLLSVLQPFIIFETPALDIQIHYPSDSARKAYEVSLSSWFVCGKGRCIINVIFDSPAAGFVSNLEALSVSLTADVTHPGLPIGDIVDKFLNLSMSVLNIGASVPTEVSDVLTTVTIDEAMVTFLKIGGSWKMKFVEVMVTSQLAPLEFLAFQLSNVQLQLSRDSGVDTGLPPDTTVQFNTDLLVGTDLNITAAFTYDTIAGYTVSFKAGQPINLMEVIQQGVKDLGVDISPLADRISDILQINVESFYFAYSKNDGTESITFSNDSGNDPTKAVELFGVGISNISVFATKTGTWSYSVSLALTSPSQPFAKFSEIPLLAGVQIMDGKVALIKGVADKKVVGQAQVPNNLSPLSITLCGTIDLSGSDFLNLVRSIIQIDQVEICIISGQEVSVSIPEASLGLKLFDVFKVNSFSLDFKAAGFGLGANLDIIADWLPKPNGDITFSLIVMEDGAFGAQCSIPEIDQPFGLRGLKITGIGFSLVWLAEAEEPQSMTAHAGMSLIDSQGEDISASFDLSYDEVGSDNWFKMDAHNMLLPTMIAAMTHGSLPSPLNTTAIKIGFKLLHVDLQPVAATFAFNADFFITALEGQVQANIDKTSGVTFAATLTPVNILGMVQINAFHGIGNGPFVFLDTTVTDIVSGNAGPPAGVTNINDPKLKGAVFAMSATLDFLGAQLDAFGLINDSGLQLSITDSENLGVPGVDFSLNETFALTINASQFIAKTNFTYSFGLSLSRFSVAGVSLGSYDGSMVNFTDDLSLAVTYSGSDWENDGLDFSAGVNVEDVLGTSVGGRVDLDASYTNLSQLPGAIESYVEDQVYDWLKDQLNPFKDPGKDLENLEKLAELLRDGFNLFGHELMNMFSEAGHV